MFPPQYRTGLLPDFGQLGRPLPINKEIISKPSTIIIKTAEGKSFQMPWTENRDPTEQEIDSFISTQPKDKSLFDKAFTPLTDIGQRTGKSLGNALTDPNRMARESGDNSWKDTIAHTVNQARGFTAGAGEEVGKLVDSFTSPGNILLTIATMGAGTFSKLAARAVPEAEESIRALVAAKSAGNTKEVVRLANEVATINKGRAAALAKAEPFKRVAQLGGAAIAGEAGYKGITERDPSQIAPFAMGLMGMHTGLPEFTPTNVDPYLPVPSVVPESVLNTVNRPGRKLGGLEDQLPLFEPGSISEPFQTSSLQQWLKPASGRLLPESSSADFVDPLATPRPIPNSFVSSPEGVVRPENRYGLVDVAPLDPITTVDPLGVEPPPRPSRATSELNKAGIDVESTKVTPRMEREDLMKRFGTGENVPKIEDITLPDYARTGEIVEKLPSELKNVTPVEIDSVTGRNLPNQENSEKYSLAQSLRDSIKANEAKGKDTKDLKGILNRFMKDEEGYLNVEDIGKATKSTYQDIKDRPLAYLNIPRSVQASIDLSAPLRQGAFLVGRKSFNESLIPMIKSLSEGKYKEIQTKIRQHPKFSQAVKDGLKFTELSENVKGREEQFASPVAEKLPIIGKGIKASSQAYNTFLNNVRISEYSNLIDSAEGLGHNPKTNAKLRKDIANFVNNATGRGSLDIAEFGRQIDSRTGKPLLDSKGNTIPHKISLEPAANALNAVLFSPRLMASRLNMIGHGLDPRNLKLISPKEYMSADNFVRKEYIKSWLSFTGAMGSVVGLGKLAGAEVSLEPTNPDFLKLKFGRTRLDPWAGVQQFARVGAQIVSDTKTSSVTGKQTKLNTGKFGAPTEAGVFADFLRSKASPIASFIIDKSVGSDFKGQPFTYKQAMMDRLTPMIMNDMWELAKSDPKLLPLIIPAGLGMSVQTYEEKPFRTTKKGKKGVH